MTSEAKALTDKPLRDEPSDAELVVRCQHHDPTAFRLLVERYRRRAWKVAYNLVGDLELARDISQEAFVRVIRAMASCDPERGFRQWFDRVVVNLSIDYLRKQHGNATVSIEFVEEPSAESDDPSDASVMAESRRLVHQVLGELPPRHKAVLVMRDIEGMDCDEIARVLGKSPGTVRWRLSRARQAFKRLWEQRQTTQAQ
jgi:RNA polymerase sigma-70 factor, ECF subfamily